METEQKRLRAVFDTNIFVAAYLSKNPYSPTIELLRRWRQGQFELLYSDDVLVEIDVSSRPGESATSTRIVCWSNCAIWLPMFKSNHRT